MIRENESEAICHCLRDMQEKYALLMIWKRGTFFLETLNLSLIDSLKGENDFGHVKLWKYFSAFVVES
jgi:hypothetical protein